MEDNCLLLSDAEVPGDCGRQRFVNNVLSYCYGRQARAEDFCASAQETSGVKDRAGGSGLCSLAGRVLRLRVTQAMCRRCRPKHREINADTGFMV